MGYPINEGLSSVFKFFYDIFPDLLDINLTASVVIAFVLCVRQFLKGAPKIFSYALWGIVLLRLLVPVSIESSVSFVPERAEFSASVDVNEVLPDLEFETARDRAANEWQRNNTPPGEPLVQTETIVDPQGYLTLIWLAGMVALVVHSLFSYFRLRKRVRVAIPLRNGIYIADDVDTAFVMGFFRPVIYLPGTLDPLEQKYIIAHEQHHIRRGDHIFKALGFLALTIYWFNPLVWAAFVLAGRDMEMSCDEAVIRRLGENLRAEYSASLLNLASGKRIFAGTPLAFGEKDPTERIRNLRRWKKPAVWVVLISLMACMILAVCLLTDPETGFPSEFRQYFVLDKKEELLSGYCDEEYADAPLIVTFQETSGPTELKLELWYQSDPESPWIQDGSAVLYLQNDHQFTIPSGVHFAVSATAEAGATGYATIRINYGQKIILDKFQNVFLMDPNTKDASEQAIAWTVPAETQTTDHADNDNWNVSIKPERVSRTGATTAFVYSGSVPGEEGAELTYGDFLSLERMEGGAWVPVEELPGYSYYVGDSSYPVVDDYGMVHEWPDRFGELPDGYYRIGKLVTLTRPDGTQETRMVYGEFDIPGAIRNGPIPLEELPEKYGSEQAMLDGCLVCPDGVPRDNIEQFRDFADACSRGEAGFFRVIYYYYGDDPHYIVHDIHYDGSIYTVNVMESGDGRIGVYEFPYLKHFTGAKEREEYPYDAYEYYVFVHDADITWQEIFDGEYKGKYMPIFQNRISYPKTPQLPAGPAEAILEFDGKALISTTDFDRLEKLWILFGDAEFLGYEPKTHSTGLGLDLVLTGANGESITIDLDLDNDICRINGEYVFYGAYDEPNYVEKLWYYLGIPSWPDPVYEKYPNAFRP